MQGKKINSQMRRYRDQARGVKNQNKQSYIMHTDKPGYQAGGVLQFSTSRPPLTHLSPNQSAPQP